MECLITLNYRMIVSILEGMMEIDLDSRGRPSSFRHHYHPSSRPFLLSLLLGNLANPVQFRPATKDPIDECNVYASPHTDAAQSSSY